MASGDVSGTVRVWDCVGEGATKGEYHIIGGRINDLAWDGDSARIIAVGEGRERFGHCITADSGNSVGEISGHSSQINSVSIRQQRPLRAATGSDDTSLVFYHGAPFKFNTSLRKHNRFVYGVAFSPDGALLVSVGADQKIWLYDGRTGEAKGKIGEDEHQGSIFSVSWANDSKRFVTASADQTVKIWDAEAGKVIQSWRMGDDSSVSIADHQVGVVWPGGRTDGLIISLNLAGDLNYFAEGTAKPYRVVQGHQKNITSIAALPGATSGSTLFTGSSEGRVCSWDVSAGLGKTVKGESHTNYVSSLVPTPTGQIVSVGWDDTLRTIDAAAAEGNFTPTSHKTDGQPKSVATLADDTTIVATHKGLSLWKNSQLEQTFPTKYTPSALAASNTIIAVGGDDLSLHIYTTSPSSSSSTPSTTPTPTPLSPLQTLSEPSSPITTLSFSPNGNFLAAGFSSGKITVYDTTSWSPTITRWSSHTGRVTSIAWNDAGTHAISAGLDTNLFLWSVAKPGRRVGVSNAHTDGVNGVVWVWAEKEKKGTEKVVSVGGDAAVKVWGVEVGE